MFKNIRLALFILTIALVVEGNVSYGAGPRTWGKSGTATGTNTVLTVKDNNAAVFTPTALCFTNVSTSVDFFINYNTGIATTVDDRGNVKVKAATTSCFSFNQPNVVGTFTIGIITASSTAEYNAFAIAAK